VNPNYIIGIKRAEFILFQISAIRSQCIKNTEASRQANSEVKIEKIVDEETC